MFKAGQLVKINLDKHYYPAFVIENGQRATEQRKSSYTGITDLRRKLKKIPPGSICLFLEYKDKSIYLLHEEQIIECHRDWIEPL